VQKVAKDEILMNEVSKISLPKWINIDVARNLFGISRFKLKKAIDNGSIKAKRDGALMLVEMDSLNTYMDALPDFVIAENSIPYRAKVSARRKFIQELVEDLKVRDLFA
jgi:hypothetical protein